MSPPWNLDALKSRVGKLQETRSILCHGDSGLGKFDWVGGRGLSPFHNSFVFEIDNPIAHEYISLSRVEGTTLSEIYQPLDNQKISQMLDQLINFLAQLHAHKGDSMGGLNGGNHGDIVVGQVVDETF